MPTYRVQDEAGTTLDLTGDSPPTEQELEEVFSSLPKEAAPLSGLARGISTGFSALGKGIATVSALTRPTAPIERWLRGDKIVPTSLADIPKMAAEDPMVKGYSDAEKFWEEQTPLTPAQKRSGWTKAGEMAGGFLPIVATGPAAPLSIGAEAFSNHLLNDFEAEKKAGKSENEAAAIAMTRGIASGTLQAAVFEFLPKPLREAGQKLLVDRFGKEWFSKFIAGRAAQTAEGALLGTASQVSENLASSRPLLEGTPSAAGGMAAAQVLMPRARAPLPQKPPLEAPGGQETPPEVAPEAKTTYSLSVKPGGWHVIEDAQGNKVFESRNPADAQAKLAELQPEGAAPPPPAPTVLPPDEQAMIDAERGNLPVPIQMVDPDTIPEGDNQPFARLKTLMGGKTIARADRTNKRILVNPKNFSEWLNDIPKENRKEAVKALFQGEEFAHLHTTDAQALDYYNSLTAAEVGIHKFIHSGDFKGDKPGFRDMTPTMWGHEFAAFRLTQLQRMTPREIAEAVGKEKWTLKSLTALDSVIRGLRETVGTEAAGKGVAITKAILDRMQNNLALAKTVSSMPAATRKGREEDHPKSVGNEMGFTYDGEHPGHEESPGLWQFTFKNVDKGDKVYGATFYTPIGAEPDAILKRANDVADKFRGTKSTDALEQTLTELEASRKLYEDSGDLKSAEELRGLIKTLKQKTSEQFMPAATRKGALNEDGDSLKLGGYWMSPEGKLTVLGEYDSHEEFAKRAIEGLPRSAAGLSDSDKIEYFKRLKKVEENDMWDYVDKFYKKGHIRVAVNNSPNGKKGIFFEGRASPTQMSELKNLAIERGAELVEDISPGGAYDEKDVDWNYNPGKPPGARRRQRVIYDPNQFNLFPAATRKQRVRELTEEEKAKLPPVPAEQRNVPYNLPRAPRQEDMPMDIAKGSGPLFQGKPTRGEYAKAPEDKLTPPLIETGYFRPSGSARQPVPEGERITPTEAGALPALSGGDVSKSYPDEKGVYPSTLAGKAGQLLDTQLDQFVKDATAGKKTGLPSITDIEKALKRATGGRLQEGAAFDMAQRLINDRLQKASGETLRLMQQSELDRRARKKSGVPIRRMPPVADAPAEGAAGFQLQPERAIEKPGMVWQRRGQRKFKAPTVAAGQAELPEVLSGVKTEDPAIRRERTLATAPESAFQTAARLEEQKLATSEESRVAGHEARQDTALVNARQARRQRVIGYLMDRMTRRPLADLKVSLERTSVKPEDIRYGTAWRNKGDGSISAWQAFSPEAEKSPTVLGMNLVDEAGVSGDLPKTVTRRVTAIMDRKSEKVHLVSTYEERGRGQVRLLDPGSGAAKQHSSLDTMLKRYRVLYSALLDQPVQNFRQDFKDLPDFMDKFGKEAAERSSASSEYQEPPAIEGTPGIKGEGADFQGPGRALVTEIDEGAIEQSGRVPMMPEEARALFDLSVSQQKGPDLSVEDVLGAIKSLKDKPNRQAISAMTKMAEGLQDANPDATPDELLQLAAKRILQTHERSKNLDEFTKNMQAQGGRPPDEPLMPAATRKRVNKRYVEDSEDPRVQILISTDPATRKVRATDFLKQPSGEWEPLGHGLFDTVKEVEDIILKPGFFNMPDGKGGSIPVKFSEDTQDQYPAATRKEPSSPRRMPKDLGVKAADEVVRVGKMARAAFKRSSTRDDLSRGANAVNTEAVVPGEKAATSIRLESAEKPKTAIGGILAVTEGNKDILSGANPLIASGAIKTRYKASPEALDKLNKLMEADPRYAQARDMMKASVRSPWTKETDLLGKDKWTKGTLGAPGLPTIPGSRAKDVRGEARKRLIERGEISREDSPSEPSVKKKTDQEALRIQDESNKRFNKQPNSKAANQIGREMMRDIKKKAIKELRESGDITVEGSEKYYDPTAKTELDKFLMMLDNGDKKADRLIDSGMWSDGRRGRAWKASNAKLRAEVEFAKAHWGNPELVNTAMQASVVLDKLFDQRVQAGFGTKFREDFLPGRYDGEFVDNDSVSFFGQSRGLLGMRSGEPKTFDSYYHAAQEGSYIPATRDIATLVGNSVKQAQRRINRDAWMESWKDVKDLATGKPFAKDPVKNKPGSRSPYSSPGEDYKLVTVGGKTMAVLKGDGVRLVRQLTDPSFVQDWAVSRFALETGQWLKHTLLMGDFFHLFRIGYYSASIMGSKAGMTPGWAALHFREADIPRAVEKGVLSESAAKWLTEKLPTNFNGKLGTATRISLSNRFLHEGLNVGQIQDAIYKDLSKNVPLFGGYNRFLFDKFTRGLMMRSALEEYQRKMAIDPKADSQTVMRETAYDLNVFFGSLGKQSWIKSAGWQDIARIFLLAPQWQEALLRKELAIPKSIGRSIADRSPQRLLEGRDTAARGIARGLVTMLVMTQVANLITRRHPTWENKEEGQKWSADMGDGVFISLLSVFNEVSHDLIRLHETKRNNWDVIKQIGSNKLGFWGRVATVLATSRKPTGEAITTTGGVLGEAAKQLVPVPITFGKIAQAAGNVATGGRIPPLEPGQAYRQALATAGFKGEIAQQPLRQIQMQASRFMQDSGLRPQTAITIPTDEPSYAKLRHSIQIGDERGAARILNELRKTHPEGHIIQVMNQWARRPFTGGYNTENMFLDSLDDDGRKTYDKAQQQKMDLLNKWVDFYIRTQP